MSKKAERLLRATEERIAQFKNVVGYLATKASVDEIPLSNRVCIVDVLLQGGWTPEGDQFIKGDKRLGLIEAGKIEFQDRYDRMVADHLHKILTEG